LRARGLPDLPIHVINNFALEAGADEAPPSELAKKPGTRRVIFAGNLGRFQNLETLTEGVALCLGAHDDLELLFLGDGAALEDQQARWGQNAQVTFGPFLPFAQAKALIAGADVGLVSLAPDIFRVSYPSKVLTYAGLGLPMLALVEPQSALAQELEDRGVGVVPASTAPADIAAALEKLLASPDRRDALAAFVDDVAAPAAAFRRWDDLLAGLATAAAEQDEVVGQCS
jgi:glycosyltransferase involved in cell wall biosynthesis